MVPGSVLFALCFVGAEPTKPELDLQNFDQSPKTSAERDEERYTDHTGKVQISVRDVSIVRGDTYFGQIPIKVRSSSNLSDLVINIYPRKPSRALSLFLHPVGLSQSKTDPLNWQLVYALRSSATASGDSFTYRLTLEVFDQKRKRRIFKKNLTHRIKIVPSLVDKASLQMNRLAFNFFQKKAFKAHRELKGKHTSLSMSELPSSLKGSRFSDPGLISFLNNRMRADIAYQRLNQATKTASPALQAEAIGILANLAWLDDVKINNLKRKLRDPQTSLRLAKQALQNLRFEEASLYASHARNSGKLTKVELAESLAQLASLKLLQGGRSEKASKLLGQAFCLEPKLKAPLKVALIREEFEIFQKRPPCPQGIIIGQVIATRRFKDGLNLVEVTGEFGPDPYHLVSGGNIELWGAGGEIIEIAKIRASHGNQNTLLSSFEDQGDIQNYLGQILIRMVVKDVSGVQIAVFGESDPVPLSIDESKTGLTQKLDWWVWAIAGVAIVGAGTAAVFLSLDTEQQRGVGPLSIRF